MRVIIHLNAVENTTLQNALDAISPTLYAAHGPAWYASKTYPIIQVIDSCTPDIDDFENALDAVINLMVVARRIPLGLYAASKCEQSVVLRCLEEARSVLHDSLIVIGEGTEAISRSRLRSLVEC